MIYLGCFIIMCNFISLRILTKSRVSLAKLVTRWLFEKYPFDLKQKLKFEKFRSYEFDIDNILCH